MRALVNNGRGHEMAGKVYSCIILDGEFTQEEIEFINTRCK